jgi:prevent-host-death family protein
MADDNDPVKAADETGSPAEVPLVRARDILGDLVDRALFDEQTTVITRRGRAAAALVPMKVFEKLVA